MGVQYELLKVRPYDKRAIGSLGHTNSFHEAVQLAEDYVEGGEAHIVWITDPANRDNVLAVVDAEGVNVG